MRKILILIVLLGVICLLGFLYYNAQRVTEFYTVSVYPSSQYDSKPKIEVKKIKNYESDSLAIEEQTNVYHTLQEMYNDRIEEAKRDGNTGDMIIFSRLRDEQRCLIKIVHKRSFKMEKLKQLILNNGVNSAEVGRYCEDSDVELNIYPILSDY